MLQWRHRKQICRLQFGMHMLPFELTFEQRTVARGKLVEMDEREDRPAIRQLFEGEHPINVDLGEGAEPEEIW